MLRNVPYIQVPIGAVCCYIFLMFCFFNTRKTKVVRFFQMIILSSIVWSGGAALMRLQVSPGIPFWYNISLLGLFMMPISIYCFVFSILDIRRYTLLIVSGIVSGVAILMNYFWDIIQAEPEVLEAADGTIRYTYTTSSGVYVAIVLEVLLCIYVTCLVRKRINHERSLLKKLVPLLIGILLVLLGNCLELIPGSTFPFSTLCGVGMAICCAYILFKQYMFELSYSLGIGSVYSAAVIAVLIPANMLYNMLENKVSEISHVGEQHVWMGVVALCAWSVLAMVLASKLADAIAERKSSKMKEKVQRFQEETASLFSESELYRKTRGTLDDLFRETEICIYIYNKDCDEFEPFEQEDAELLSVKEKNEIVRLIHNADKWNKRWEIAPLKYDNKLLGFICLKFTSREKFSHVEQECFRQVATYASICLKNIMIFEEVYQLSIHDELTGLYNRNYWKNYMQEKLSLSERHAFIYLDMDDFKLFNELYGGACGDDILRWCGKIIKEAAEKENAVAFRVGSNEFLIDIQSNDSEKLMELAKGIQQNVKRNAPEKPRVLQPITFSIGISMYPKSATDFSELLKQVEKASFFAKKNGKNRIEMYETGLEGNTEKTSRDKTYEQIAPTIFALMAAIDAKDSYTFKHSTLVSEYAVLLAKEIGLQNNEIQILKEAGLLHDIGKIGIPESILMKQGKLTSEEYEIMKKHVTNSIEMIHFLPDMSYVIPAVLSHHERYDGKGYPRGIAGEEIPLLGRILAVCDSFEAMISKRSYKEAMTMEYAMEELEANKGTQFDPKLADAFIKLVKEGKVQAGDSVAYEKVSNKFLTVHEG